MRQSEIPSDLESVYEVTMRSTEIKLIFVIFLGLCNCNVVPKKLSADANFVDADVEFSSMEDEVKESRLSSRFSEGDDGNIAELDKAEKYQEDIILSQEQIDTLFTDTRTGLIDEKYRWATDANGFVVVPYEISSDSQYSEYDELTSDSDY
jgi:hypothetical protein